MDIQKARELEPTEITKQVKEAEDTMFRLKFQMTMGQNDGIKKYRELRKDKARMLTVQHERAIESRSAQAPVAKALVTKVPVGKAPVVAPKAAKTAAVAKAPAAKVKEGKK
jgi:large subunit ribosomal protein L29